MKTLRQCAVLVVFLYLVASFLWLLVRDGWCPPHRLEPLHAAESPRSYGTAQAALPVEDTNDRSPLEQLRGIHFAKKRMTNRN